MISVWRRIFREYVGGLDADFVPFYIRDLSIPDFGFGGGGRGSSWNQSC